MNNQICASHGGRTSAGTLSRSVGHGRGKTPLSVVENALIRFFDLVLSWRENARSRYALSQLNDHMLSDIGIGRASAEHEASVPFWRSRFRD